MKALNERVAACTKSSDPSAVLDSAALSQADELSELLTRSTTAGQPADIVALAALTWLYWCRSEATEEEQDREACFDYSSQILPVAPDVLPDPVRLLLQAYARVSVTYFAGLTIERGVSFLQEYQRTGRADRLSRAIFCFRQALADLPSDDPDRRVPLSNLGAALQTRFLRTGQLADLDEAIGVGRKVIAATPADHSDRPAVLSNLGAALHARFGRSGQSADLDEAIDLQRQAVDTAPSSHHSRYMYLSNLCYSLHTRSYRTGQSADLDDAIDIGRQAVTATPLDRSDRPAVLFTLGAALHTRFDRTGQSVDRDEAISLYQRALATTPTHHVNRAMYLSKLGNALRDRQDLDEAVNLQRQAVAAVPADQVIHPGYLSALASSLRDRFDRSGQSADLDEAIDLHRQAVAATPIDDNARPGRLSNLGNALRDRFDRSGQSADLDEAIDLHRQAVVAVPGDHPDRATCLANLAAALRARFELSGEPADLDRAIECLREATAVVMASAWQRLEAAVMWGRWAYAAGNPGSGVEGFAVAVELLSQVAWHGLDQQTRQARLAMWPNVATAAAACAVAAGQPYRAVELLEAGRSLLWAQALNLRSDLAQLAEHAPDLAAGLEQARAELELPLPDLASALHSGSAAPHGVAPIHAIQQEALEHRRRAARQWDDLLKQARRMTGFENFLAPLPFAELRHAAADGPVVIVNASRPSCHAIIVTAGTGGIRVMDLPGLTWDDVVDRANTLLVAEHFAAGTDRRPFLERERDRHAVFDILEWLWDTIAQPVLHALGYTASRSEPIEDWPRVWWCPTGPLAVLPLHAAGRYPRSAIQQASQGTSAGDSVAGRVVSSYTPTLTALLRARRPGRLGQAQQLAVGMPDTPGYDALPAVADELDVLVKYIPRRLARHVPGRLARWLPERRHALHRLVGPKATTARVLDALPRYSWLHIACHGSQHPADLWNRAFILYDGPLTVTALAALRHEHADLAYLSVCQTAREGALLPNEAIHLAGAMQLIGYRHVIATMWTADDNPAPQMADAIYTYLTATGYADATRAAYALHQAVTALRQQVPDQPLVWAPYIHIGA